MKIEKILGSFIYLFYGLGGVSSLFFPYRVLSSIANDKTAYVWAAFMALGGLISFFGVVFDSWTIEQIGLPLLIMCFIVLSVVAIASLFLTEDYFLASGLFSLGNVAFFTLRYKRIKDSVKFSREN